MHSLSGRLSALFKFVQVFSDWRSIQNFRRPPKSAEFLSFRLRVLGGNSIQCRPQTSDLDALYNDFFLVCQIPPADLQPRTILDLGANIGTAMAYYAARFPEAEIWANLNWTRTISRWQPRTCRTSTAAI